jgi:hypothetical protein
MYKGDDQTGIINSPTAPSVPLCCPLCTLWLSLLHLTTKDNEGYHEGHKVLVF